MTINLGKKERQFIDSLYALNKIGQEVESRVEFLKQYTGYTNVSGDTPQEQLCGLELGLIDVQVS